MRTDMAVNGAGRTGDERELLVRHLCDFSVKGLVPMFDRNKKVFCYRVRRTGDGIACEGESLRYTLIALLGLGRYEQHSGPSPISIPEMFNETVRRNAFMEYAGDAGLVLWLTAMVAPERLGEVYARFDIERTWDRAQDAAGGMTTELSWLLTGLCYALLKGGQPLPGLTDTAAKVFNRIKENYGGKGIFRHQHGKSIAGVVRRNIGSFADQVYPIYALSRFAETHGSEEALAMSRQCSETICELQGRLGQWWWHYDARTGKTAGRYPVFSVHQEGMAPLALFAAAEKTGVNYDAPIYRGLEWVLGKNELGIDMRDPVRNTIWRSLSQKKWKQHRELLLSMMGSRVREQAPANLEVLYECRPYCFGWLLYAFADKAGTRPSKQHVLSSKEE